MTIISCPHCGDGTVDTSVRNHCLLCGRDISTTYITVPEYSDEVGPYIKKESYCGEYFDPGWPDKETRYMCRRKKGHEGPHDEHED